MVNQLGKFLSNLAQLTQPLRELLAQSRSWSWDSPQETAFDKVKQEFLKPVTLALYNPNAQAKVSADASSYGLGAVLLQQCQDGWKPVAFASRSMTETERRYAQIEKEALATTWACEKFSDFILGKRIQVETDHKPLVPLLGAKDLDRLPPRILRFRLRLDRFDYDIKHVPGKELYTADTLSRAPVKSGEPSDDYESNLQDLTELFVISTVAHLPASGYRLETYQKSQAEDPVCQQVLQFCQTQWPDKKDLEPPLIPYREQRGTLTVAEGILMQGKRIVVLKSLQLTTLEKLHGAGHLGIVRCRLRAKMSVWWPGISKQLAQFVTNCPKCARDSRPKKEPLIPTSLPDYPWEMIAADLFHLEGKDYMVIVDYFSRFPEVKKLRSTTSQTVINCFKTVFARYGIPETIRTDNGPQFSSKEFADFSKKYNFRHITSSPHFPASNGQAESAVKIVKRLLKDAEDPFNALLSYRATPLPWAGRSPAELLMGRKIRSMLPMSKKELIPQWPYLRDFRRDNADFKRTQKALYDRRHGVQELPNIPDNTRVWVTTDDRITAGTTVRMADTPRSYLVRTPHGDLRRNRAQLNVNPESTTEQTQEDQTTSSSIMTRSRTGTRLRPPERLA